MRRPNLFQRESQMDSTMTPMIDVVFLLLVFFVWTASFQIIEYMLPSSLSSQLGANSTDASEPLPEEDFEKVIVRITWDAGTPRFTLNEVELNSLTQVMDRLTSVFQVKNDAPVIIHPDSEVPLDPVIKIFDAAKNVGFEKVSFAVNKSSL